MSMDDGGVPEIDTDDVKARLRSELSRLRLPFPTLCQRGDLSEAEALRALEIGVAGFPETLHVLERLSVALGKDPSWLPFGCDSANSTATDFLTGIKQLLWRFVYKGEIPHAVGIRFQAFVVNRFRSVPTGGPGVALRSDAPPQNLKDMARLYADFLEQDKTS
jgi:hypothetical protein